MKAYATINHTGAIQQVELQEQTLLEHDLLVEIKAVSVNPVDVKVRYSKNGCIDNKKIVGYDASGIIKAVGDKVSLFNVGDEVFYAGDISRPGTNMQYHLVDERIVGKKPHSISFAEVAAYPLTSITAYEALFEKLGFSLSEPNNNQGKTVLIISGAGGVGSMAIQLAKLAGLTVIATASRPESIQWVKQLGAAHVINHRQSMSEQLSALSYTHVDAILCLNDTVGHWQEMAKMIKPFGTICSIVESNQPMDMDILLGKSVTFAWEFMFTRALQKGHDMIKQHQLLNHISSLIDQHKLQSTLTKKLTPISAENIEQAHQYVLAGDMIGKVVIADE